MSCESEFRSEGSVPLSFCEARFIEVTRFALHFTPFQSQKLVPVPDHPDGVGLKALASLDMNAPSSATAVNARERNRNGKRLENRVFGFNLGGAIMVVVLRVCDEVFVQRERTEGRREDDNCANLMRQ